jgi:outer membrane biosynthesis protein TonB
MYADLENIEARGKRKKEKKKGLFSSFGSKDELEPEQPEQTEQPEPEERTATEPAPQASPKPEPSPEPQPAPKPAPAPKPQPAHPSGWQPLAGGKLRKAEEELVEYKRWLNQGFKSGMLTKEQCVAMVRKKEAELGLRPPE